MLNLQGTVKSDHVTRLSLYLVYQIQMFIKEVLEFDIGETMAYRLEVYTDSRSVARHCLGILSILQ